MFGISVTCPCCGSWRTRNAYFHFDPKRTFRNREWYNIRGCRSCGVLWLDPLPTARDVDAYYASGQGWEAAKHVKSFENPDFRNAKKMEAFRRLHDMLTPSMDPGLLASSGKSMLDFGCGPGWALDAFQEKGWKVTGVELAPKVRAFAQLRHRVVDTIPENEKFDFILLNHALEHLRRPLGMLKSITRLLKPRGYLYVGVPDFLAVVRQKDTRPFISCHHLFAYSHASLTNLGAMARLERVLHLDSPESDELFSVGYRELRMLLRKSDTRVPRVTRPLDPALQALAEFRRQRDPRLEWIPVAQELADAKNKIAEERAHHEHKRKMQEAKIERRLARERLRAAKNKTTSPDT